MGISLHKVILSAGLLCLVHAGISAAQHRSFVRLTEQEFSTLPIDIVIQTVVGLFLSAYGILVVSGEFKSIRVNAEAKGKSTETFGDRFSFCTFDHRGKVLFANN